MGSTEPGPEVWTIIVAAGLGSRFGGPKHAVELAGHSLVDRSVAVATRHCVGVVVVLPAEATAAVGVDLSVESPTLTVDVVSGDSTRSGSVRRGLAAVPPEAEIILVHDGARPLATDKIYESVIAAVAGGAEAVIPCVPITDTVRHRGGGVIDRSELVAVQTPQAFQAAALRAAHASARDATDDAALVEAMGGTVVLVDGDRGNLKITTRLDLGIAAGLLEQGDGDA